MWKAGHSLLKSKMKEEDALLGGEMSGHIFFADRYFGYDDAIYASCRLLEILSRSEPEDPGAFGGSSQDLDHAGNPGDCPDEQKFDSWKRSGNLFAKKSPWWMWMGCGSCSRTGGVWLGHRIPSRSWFCASKPDRKNACGKSGSWWKRGWPKFSQIGLPR